ncbi:hypothetical protein D6783_05400 [Candidatus Woesearchaeota archaeon]|nr:MAG: hypothetical protein D6783_05400 [Candidatus Woesearchaeota archaeon]
MTRQEREVLRDTRSSSEDRGGERQERRVSSGVEGLDTLLHGGFLPGRNILVSGPCGSGKTTLATQFLWKGVEEGETCLYVSLEESKKKLYEDMARLGFDFAKMEASGRFRFIGGPLAKVTHYMSKVNAKPHHLISEIEEVIRELGVTRVVIDSLTLFSMVLTSNEERRLALAALGNMLSARRVTSLLLAETKEGSFEVSTYGIEEFIADGVVALYNIRRGATFVPGIVVRKLRGSDHDREIRLVKVTEKGVVVFPEETLFTDV